MPLRLIPRKAWRLNLILWMVPLLGLGVATLILIQGSASIPDSSVVSHTGFPASSAMRWKAFAIASGAVIGSMLLALVSRRGFGFFAGASTVLLVACLSMWLRSHWSADYLGCLLAPESDRAGWGYFHSDSGGMLVGSSNYRVDKPYTVTAGHLSREASGKYPVMRAPMASMETMQKFARFRRWGFGAWLAYDPYPMMVFQEIDRPYIAAPYWFLTICTIPLPALWVRRSLRRSRERKGFQTGICIQCGYDLRASPNRCPECGEVVSKPSSAGSAMK
jgi:hypothetical protein